jgi:hypothetical protein
LVTNIRLGWKCVTVVSNTLAYWGKEFITTVKNFTAEGPMI